MEKVRAMHPPDYISPSAGIATKKSIVIVLPLTARKPGTTFGLRPKFLNMMLRIELHM